MDNKPPNDDDKHHHHRYRTNPKPNPNPNIFRNHSLLVRANLEAALELKLPSPATTAKADYSADCGICYAYRLQRDDAAGDGGKKRDYIVSDA